MSEEATRLVQLIHPQKGRRVAMVNEPSLALLEDTASVYALALDSIKQGGKLESLVHTRVSGDLLDYTEVYEGRHEWKLLPSFDHPDHPASCLVSGTGLTHKNSALNRQMMHHDPGKTITDSMQMYQWGLEGGRPEKGTIGIQPEWFYKGTGDCLVGHGNSLEIPAYADDGGEEPEVAGIYVVDEKGEPWRIGFTTGNEFSDHVMEKKNYLYLAPSKLRNCAIGPELALTSDFSSVQGTVSILRNGKPFWEKEIHSGEEHMAHSLSNIEHHHFKYAAHRIPLKAHIHFFGADAFSFGDQLKLVEGDIMSVHWKEWGRPLQNPLRISTGTMTLQTVKPLA